MSDLPYDSNLPADVQCFIKELSELTVKYGIMIWACGCCCGPQLVALSESHRQGGTALLHNLDWDKKKGHYIGDKPWK